MDAQAFQDGDMRALAGVVDELTGAVWRLAQIGFLIETDGPTYVLGVDQPRDLERLVIRALTRALTPHRRARVTDAADLRIRVLKDAAEQLALTAEREGRTTDLGTEGQPPGVPWLTAVLSDPERLAPTHDDDVVGFGTRQQLAYAAAVRDEVLAHFDETRRNIALRLWQDGMEATEIARQLSKGPAFVRATERSIRFALGRALHANAKSESARSGAASETAHERPDDAWIDLLLAGEATLGIPPITKHRIRREILKRTFQAERPSYGRRALWAAAIAAIAATLWLLVFTRKLPGPEDDRVPSPYVAATCTGPCRPGSAIALKVLAPKQARFVAFGSRSKQTTLGPTTILTDEAGRSITLPFGARDAAQRMPYPGTVPKDAALGPLVVEAIFSKEELTPRQIEDVLRGRPLAKSVIMTASTTLTLAEVLQNR
ncbi:MAG: hypothetical protein IPK13_26425 [Deltaproteobacteria bacterium]|nr:hypothetical protein [Deltaproteobacteria bacterium]